MRLHAHAATCAVAVALIASCRSAAPEPAAPPEAQAAGPPASALAGVVRALETLDAVRPEGSLTQLRALEGDTLLERTSGAESVRVFLYLTEFADTVEQAQAGFEELRAALEREASSTSRVEPASAERVRRVLGEMAWDRPGREDMLSYSDVIRLAVRPGHLAASPEEGGSAGGPAATDSLESYVRRAAAERIGRVSLAVSASATPHDPRDHRFRIAPADEFARYTRAEIGEFLAALEGGSPAARLTSIRIERSQHEPDVHAERGWTFEAELGLRAPGAGGPVSGLEGR